MANWTRIVVVLLATALVVTTIGWIRATDTVRLGNDAPARFDDCKFDGANLVLGYSYGANQLVAPSVDTRSADRIVVQLETKVGDGITPAIGLAGQAEFSIFGAAVNTVIEYPDGERLECN